MSACEAYAPLIYSQFYKTFLIDDILREMAMSQKNYFRLNKANAKDGRDHYFIFKIVTEKDNKTVRKYEYLGRKLTIE